MLYHRLRSSNNRTWDRVAREEFHSGNKDRFVRASRNSQTIWAPSRTLVLLRVIATSSLHGAADR